VRGLGAGNYDRDYFRERRTAEDVRQPHSIVLQTLAELGAVGVLALAVFFALVLAGLLRCARLGRADPWPRALAVAAGGTFLAWTVQANVDWPHLLPGLTGLALAAAAVLLRPWAAGDDDSPPSLTRARLAALVALAAVLAAGAVAVARPVMAAHLRAQAREALITSPGRALAKADDSLALNRDAVPTYYVKAAALGRRDDYLGARAVLLAAARREPHDFVTWALLGDLAFRRGDRPLAVAYYARAARLNPRDRALANTLRAARR
jgi:O-antigen ligase